MAAISAGAGVSPRRSFQRGLGRHHRPRAHALVSGDVLSAAAAHRQRARPELQPDRLDHDLPVRRRRDRQHSRRHPRRYRRPQGPADGGVAVLDRLSLSADRLLARLLDAARLRALVGIGNNLWHPTAIPSLADRFPERKGLVLSFHGMGGNVGDAIAPLVVGAR